MNRGEEVRIYWANGGPKFTSSWHAIGNVWSKLYRNGDLVSEPARFVETTSVPPGSVSVATIDTPVPEPIKLVDHAISREDKRGELAVLPVHGEERPNIYEVIEKGAGNDRGEETDTFDGWLSGVSNYTGIVDKTGVANPRVAVGAQGNRGNFAYEPAAIKISRGTTLTWEWTGAGEKVSRRCRRRRSVLN